MLDSRTDSRFKLDDWLTALKRLVVRDDFKVQFIVLNHTFHSPQVEPQIVRVENLELLDRFEVLHMFRRHLRNFEQTDGALVVNQRATFDVCLRLVGHL